jgi:hypothetical protein
MVIDQRNAGASVTPTSGQYLLDRWLAVLTQASKFTVQQNAGSVTPPVGFTNYLGVTSSSAYSVGSGDAFLIAQYVEGFNTSDLNWGTANASSITLSFWVRSSLTGTFGGAILNNANNRSYLFSYTINSANTWEQKSVTIAGDTSGTWVTNNGVGLRIRFGLGSGSTFTGTAGSWGTSDLVQPTGSVSVVGTSGATFYITGVQLEKGTAASPFENRLYGTELALCQRYCIVYKDTTASTPFATGVMLTSTRALPMLSFPVQMRSSPTAIFSSASNYLTVSNGGQSVSAITTNGTDIYGALLDVTTSVGTAGYAVYLRANFSGVATVFNSEL